MLAFPVRTHAPTRARLAPGDRAITLAVRRDAGGVRYSGRIAISQFEPNGALFSIVCADACFRTPQQFERRFDPLVMPALCMAK